MKTLHIYQGSGEEYISDEDITDLLITYNDTEDALNKYQDSSDVVLHSSSMVHLFNAENLIEKGWDVYFHDFTGEHQVTKNMVLEKDPIANRFYFTQMLQL